MTFTLSYLDGVFVNKQAVIAYLEQEIRRLDEEIDQNPWPACPVFSRAVTIADERAAYPSESGDKVGVLHAWKLQARWCVKDVFPSFEAGEPVNTQPFIAMRAKFAMDYKKTILIGDAGSTGLLNSPDVTVVRSTLRGLEAATGGRPGHLVAPEIFLKTERKISHYPSEHGDGRVLLYDPDPANLQYPVSPMHMTPVMYRPPVARLDDVGDLIIEPAHFYTTFFCRLGELEIRRPSTMLYIDIEGDDVMAVTRDVVRGVV